MGLHPLSAIGRKRTINALSAWPQNLSIRGPFVFSTDFDFQKTPISFYFLSYTRRFPEKPPRGKGVSAEWLKASAEGSPLEVQVLLSAIDRKALLNALSAWPQNLSISGPFMFSLALTSQKRLFSCFLSYTCRFPEKSMRGKGVSAEWLKTLG